VQDALKERLPLTGVAARSKKEKEEKEAIVQDAKPKDARLPQELRTAAHQKKQEREDDGRERNLGVEQIRALASPPSAEHPSEKTGSPAASIFVPEAPLPTAHDVAAPTASPLAVTMAQTSDLATESANVAAIFSAAPNPSLHGSPAHPAIGPNLVQPDIVGPTGINFSAGTRSKEADIHRASVPSAPTHISPVLAGYKLNEASLRMIEKQFAAFIGPVAKVLVKRATSKTNSPEELYTILAASLESEADRKAFLARRAELAQPDLASLEASPPKIAAPGLVSKDELTAAVIETAARKLAAYLGPIALVLAKKEAKQTDSLRSFHQNLAAHLESDGERARFLNETGFGDRIIEPSSRREEASSVRHSEQLKKERLEEHIAPPPQAETPQQSEESEKPNPARKAS
jgi:hypothetical protein